MKFIKKWINKYAHFVSTRPYLILIVVIIMTILASIFASNVKTVAMNNKDALPDDVEVIYAYNYLADNFGTTSSIYIVIEIDPESKGSNEIRDLRDPRAISYFNLLSESALHLDNVKGVNSPSTLLKSSNNGVLPKSKREIIKLSESLITFSQVVNSDYSMGLVKLTLGEDYDDGEITNDIIRLVEQIPQPAGLIAQPGGSVAEGPVMSEQLGPDMAKTSQFSLLGIILILILLFRSARYSLTPLGVIGIGIMWAFGYLGLIGMNLNSATSGVISMIMGIGIDFGIQIVTRYKEELRTHDGQTAMTVTMNAVFMPMATTTLSALIGFKAMTMGQLTFMAELGTIMGYGIAACFVAAITVVPTVLVLTERLKNYFDSKGFALLGFKPKLKKNKQTRNHSRKLSRVSKRRKLKNPAKLLSNISIIFGGHKNE